MPTTYFGQYVPQEDTTASIVETQSQNTSENVREFFYMNGLDKYYNPKSVTSKKVYEIYESIDEGYSLIISRREIFFHIYFLVKQEQNETEITNILLEKGHIQFDHRNIELSDRL